MKKNLKLFAILMVSLMVMIACNNDDTTTEDSEDNLNESTSETENDEVADEDSNTENEKNEEVPEAQIDDEVPVLALGETGVIEDTLGTYEVTPKSFQFTDSLGEGSEKEVALNGNLAVVEIDIKNIGSETLNLEDITKAELISTTGAGGTGYSDYAGITQFKGEIKPEENFIGHIVFDVSERIYYEMSFGFGMPSNISNEVRWIIDPEDAE